MTKSERQLLILLASFVKEDQHRQRFETTVKAIAEAITLVVAEREIEELPI